jgi:hypothetical protein
MKNRLAPLGAALSVVALLSWLVVSTSREAVPDPADPADRGLGRMEVGEGGSVLPCAVPLAWRAPDPHPRFGHSAAEARSAVEEAAALWGEASGHGLFAHDPDGGFPIRFVYDERQARTEQRRLAEARFDRATGRLEVRRQGVREIREEHAAARSAYEEQARDLEERIARHNAAVRRWNREEGRSDEVLHELRSAEETLETARVKLDEMADEVEVLARRIEAEEAELARRVGEQDRRAEALKRAFPPTPVEAGAYREEVVLDGGIVTAIAREIRVHRFSDRHELVRVLAHELGHALGVGHASRAGSLMSPEHGWDDAAPEPPAVGPEDLELLRQRCPEL